MWRKSGNLEALERKKNLILHPTPHCVLYVIYLFYLSSFYSLEPLWCFKVSGNHFNGDWCVKRLRIFVYVSMYSCISAFRPRFSCWRTVSLPWRMSPSALCLALLLTYSSLWSRQMRDMSSFQMSGCWQNCVAVLSSALRGTNRWESFQTDQSVKSRLCEKLDESWFCTADKIHGYRMLMQMLYRW